MNLFRLFTSRGAQFWVRSLNSDSAIRLVEGLAKDRVSCWFIGGSIPKHATVFYAS